VEAVEETLTVTGESPIVDVETASLQRVLTTRPSSGDTPGHRAPEGQAPLLR